MSSTAAQTTNAEAAKSAEVQESVQKPSETIQGDAVDTAKLGEAVPATGNLSTGEQPEHADEEDDEEEFIPRGKPYRPVAGNPKPIKR